MLLLSFDVINLHDIKITFFAFEANLSVLCFMEEEIQKHRLNGNAWIKEVLKNKTISCL